MSNLHVLLPFGAAALAAGALVQHQRHKTPYPLPPGPKGDPIIGNLRQMPTENIPQAWAKFGEEYGPLTYLNVLGRHLLIINTQEAAIDLLEKRGKNYSDRPHATMFVDVVGKYGEQYLYPRITH
jgi:hypothetical protein